MVDLVAQVDPQPVGRAGAASTRQISQALYVTEGTIQKHLQNVFEKVGVGSRQALVKRLYLDTIFPEPSASTPRGLAGPTPRLVFGKGGFPSRSYAMPGPRALPWIS